VWRDRGLRDDAWVDRVQDAEQFGVDVCDAQAVQCLADVGHECGRPAQVGAGVARQAQLG
jgi:hypothetical protein